MKRHIWNHLTWSGSIVPRGIPKVVVVDDDHAARESLRFLLEIIGYAVETLSRQPNY